MGTTADDVCDLDRPLCSGRFGKGREGRSMKKSSGACPDPNDALFCTDRRDGEASTRLVEAVRVSESFLCRVWTGVDPMLEAGVVGRYTLALVSSSDDDSSLELESEEESDSSSDSEESELSVPEESEDDGELLGRLDEP